MNLPSISIRRPVFIACLFLLILGLGGLARSRLSTSLYPDVSFPVVTVVVPFPGTGPEEMEEQVAKPIETVLNSIAGVREVRSVSLDNAAIMTAVFKMDVDVRFAEQKVIELVGRLRGDLPSGIREPIIRSVDPTDTPVVTLSLSANLDEAGLFDLADREVRPRLEQVGDVGQVEILGARKREIQVELDRDKLKAQEMSAEEVVGRLGAAGVNVPAGEIQNASRATLLRTVGQFESLEAIRRTPIRFVGNEEVTSLGEVATVRDGLEDEKNRVYIDGKRALTLSVYRRSGANTIGVSDGVQARMQEMAKDLEAKIPGFRLTVIRDGARAVREGVADATEAIEFGILLTVGVVFLFLGSFRSTVITGLALPNSLLGAFLLMWIAGFSVNITTLAALALAVGLLIDDAIVVRENIFRRIEEGEPPAQAAVLGTTEVTLAVVATTLTVLSVFAPVSFLQGIIGQFFKEFGLTICFAMMISLFDSLTVAPMLSAYFAGKHEGKAKSSRSSRLLRIANAILKPFNRFQNAQARFYARSLAASLRHPLRTLLVAGLVFGLSFVVLSRVPKSFVPSQATGEFQVSLTLPPGVSLEATDHLVHEVDARLHQHAEIARTVATVGGSLGENNLAVILVQLKPAAERSLSTEAMKERVRDDLRAFPQGSPRVEDLVDIGGGAGAPYSIHLTGENIDDLKRVSSELVAKLRAGPNLKDVDRSYRPGSRELVVKLEPGREEDYGISAAEAGQELRLLVAGATPARFHEGGREYDVRVRLRPDQRDLGKNFDRVVVPNLNHRLIPLRLVAKKVETEAAAKIERQDRKRYIEVTGDLNPSGHGLAAALDETKSLFDSGEVKLAPGMNYLFAGQTKDFEELLGSVALAVALSIGAMYLVLASLYESFFVPFSIMLVLPLAICGAFYALWITRSSLDIYSMIGCVLLMGVAAKNSILLVDAIQEGLREGQSLKDAIARAGRVRFRPIMMTSFALIAGMLPMALPLQEAARQRAPMAIAVIGGVITSTILTLVVVPAAYGYILRLQNWTLARMRGILHPVTDALEAPSQPAGRPKREPSPRPRIWS